MLAVQGAHVGASGAVMGRRTKGGQIKGKLVGKPERRQPPKPEQQIKIASDIFAALCAQYPNRLIVLRNENGRIVARRDRSDMPHYELTPPLIQ